jgi:hypothetical protein
MPISRGTLRRLSELMEANTAPGRRYSNMPAYNDWLKEHDFNPYMRDDEFDALLNYAESPSLVDSDTMDNLFDSYAIKAPPLLLRGEGLHRDFPRIEHAAWPHLRGYTSTTINPKVAHSFAEGSADRLDGIYGDNDLDGPEGPLGRYQSMIARLKTQHQPGKPVYALPLPMSDESEFILSPYTRRRFVKDEGELPDDDRIVKRLYDLHKKYGGRVSANT